jgi:hypothetical protein
MSMDDGEEATRYISGFSMISKKNSAIFFPPNGEGSTRAI